MIPRVECICSYSPGLCTAHPSDAPPKKTMGTDEERARAWWRETFPEAVTCPPGLAALLRAVRAEEREACARECEAEIASYDSGTHEYFARGAQGCIDRIRARGGR